MLRSIHCKIARPVVRCVARTQATATATNLAQLDLYNPTDEHASLRTMLREFVEKEVDPQALEFNRKEKFNVELFRKLGNLGLLGITVEPEFGGSGMDATAAVIAHGVFLLACPFLLSLVSFHVLSFCRGALRGRPCFLPVLPGPQHALREQPCPQR
jgi:isovaleryl-CoA dehydrogenase